MPYNTRKRKLKRIQETREAAIAAVEPRFQEILRRPFTGRTDAELNAWEYQVAQELTGAADIELDESWQYSRPRPRAFCPLCGSGAELSGRGTMGWMVPDSLVRHLLHGSRRRRCDVLQTISQTLFAEFVSDL